jgi:hypothetical protein
MHPREPASRACASHPPSRSFSGIVPPARMGIEIKEYLRLGLEHANLARQFLKQVV